MSEHAVPLLVYVAGPFSGKPPTWIPKWLWSRLPLFVARPLLRRGVERNIRRAEGVGIELASHGYCPVIPHANTADPRFELVQEYEFWIDATVAMMLRCDAVLMMPGWESSSGARAEFAVAREKLIPLFLDIRSLDRARNSVAWRRDTLNEYADKARRKCGKMRIEPTL